MEFTLFDINRVFTLISGKLTFWYEAFIKNIPNLIVAIVALFVFFYLGKTLRNLVKKVLQKVSYKKSVNEILGTTTNVIVIVVGIFTALEIIGLEKTVTSILAGAGVIGLALGFAFQEIAANFVSGVLIAFREPYQIGDIIEIDKIVGQVTNIELRTTGITTYQGLEVFIPNKDMFTKPFINYTSTPQRRVDISVGVSYHDDLEKVEKVTREALEAIEGRLENVPVEVFFEEFGASSINLTARVWIHYKTGVAFYKARHQAVINIKKYYDQNGISIPFPIRTIEFSNPLDVNKG
ncbi:mechanosensitive ion channel protein MscS [Halobacteriovorax sp. DA5]|nr:mechanosensitive ion channel protein MscS [Halobacteriovorax sp. DA5]